jgi:hypothetical protein
VQEVEITRLESMGDAGGELAGSELQPPVGSSPFNLKLEGWALGHSGPPRRLRVVAVQPLADGPPLRRVLVATEPNVQESGFRTACSLIGVPPEFHLQVEATFEGAPAVTIGHIEGRRRRIDTGYRPRFQPILVRTLGRAGSTWLTQLLGAHPDAVAYRPFDFEPRMLDYWMEIVRTLSHPHSYAQAVDPDVDVERAWWVGRRRSRGPLSVGGEPDVERWLETESVERLAGFAQAQVDAFYERVAASGGKPDARRIVERAHEWHEIELARELYEDARLVFLVRDMRDLLASRMAFNRKTGLAQFGYDATVGDEEYVRGVMRTEIDDLYESWRALRGDAMLLRYEDLMLQPRETLRTLFEHTGLAAGDDTVAQVLERARARAPERQAGHRTTADENASIGRWRNDLPPALQAACAEAFAAPLAAFGYETGTRGAP